MKKKPENTIFIGIISKVKSIIVRFMNYCKEKLIFHGGYKFVYKALTVILLLIGLYIIIYPFIPGLMYYIFKGNYIFPYKMDKDDIAGVNIENDNDEIPTENRIVIPKIDVDMTIVEGNSEDALDLGIWHIPGTGIPGRGNMVLTGHRFGYEFLPENIRNSTSFYNLDKLEDGDFVVIYWKGSEYDYIIYGSEVVDKMETRIEDQTEEERLTLYTCHPIGQNDKRLVYYARPYN